MSEQHATVTQLRFYPIKGCGGFPVASAMLAPTGLEIDGVGDREWVIVDGDGEFLSQRELPQMALIRTRLTQTQLELSAPAMPMLAVPLDHRGDSVRVRVWNDEVNAVGQGAEADAWLKQLLGHGARLTRFAPSAKRLSHPRYTGATPAPYKFADAFALLMTSDASLADLNQRLAQRGAAAVTHERFRPNIVVAGLEPFDEDYVGRIEVGNALLRVVKPCVRCTVPNVDPATAEVGAEPGATLATFRNDTEAGGLTFGVNAIVERGGAAIAVGDAVKVSLRW